MTPAKVLKVVPVLYPVCTSETIARCAETICNGVTPSRDSVLKHLHKLEQLGKVKCCGTIDLTTFSMSYGVREKLWRRA